MRIHLDDYKHAQYWFNLYIYCNLKQRNCFAYMGNQQSYLIAVLERSNIL